MDRKIRVQLKRLRKEFDLTQQELAEKLGVSRQSIIAVECGKFLPSIELAYEIANFFGLPLNDIFIYAHQNGNQNNPASEAGEEGGNMPNHLEEWHPFHEMESFRNTMNRMMEDFFSERESVAKSRSTLVAPATDILDKKDKIIIKSVIPGVEEKDIDITIGDDAITISGERKEETEEEEGEKYFHREIVYGSFQRIIPLPTNIDKDKADATFKNGVLTITLPKKEEAKPKQITIKPKKG